jgi:hypothetical protein
MEKFTLLFEEYVMKAIVMTEKILATDFSTEVNFDHFTDNRERLFHVMDQISRQIDWTKIPDEKRVELNRQIDYIKKLDEKLLVKLQEYQQEVKQDIERTVRSKDNIKGYNLNDVK